MMKHSFSRILAAVLAALTLASCTGMTPPSDTPENPQNDETVSVPSDFFVVEISGVGQFASGFSRGEDSLYKINTNTGSYVNICPDPLCKHDSPECPVYNAGWCYETFGNYIYFSRHIDEAMPGTYADGYAGLFRYDMEKNTIETVIPYDKDHPDDFPALDYFPTENYLFFTRVKTLDEGSSNDDTDEETKPKYERSYWRLEFATGEIIQIPNENVHLEKGFNPTEFEKTRIQWTNGLICRYTDYDWNWLDVPEEPMTDRERIVHNGRTYRIDPTNDEHSEFSIYILDEESEEKTLIKDHVISWNFIEEKDIIIYTKAHNASPENLLYAAEPDVNPYSEAVYNLSQNEVWTINGDGTDEKLLCKVEDPYLDKTAIGGFSQKSKTFITNNCVLFDIFHWWYNPTGYQNYETGEVYPAPSVDYLNGFVIVNVDTGEYKVVYPDGDPQTCASRDITAEIKKQG